MTAVSSLYVDLTLNSAAFTTQMRAAANSVKTAADSMKRELDNLGKELFDIKAIGKTIVGVFAVEKLVEKFSEVNREAVNLVLHIEDVAQATGLTNTQVQAFALAAQKTGIGIDVAGKALEIFARNLGQARQAEGALYGALVNTNPKLLSQIAYAKSTGEAVEIYVKALNKVPVASDKARLRAAAFGRGSNELEASIRLLDDGFGSLAKQFATLIISDAQIVQVDRTRAAFALLNEAVVVGWAKGLGSASDASNTFAQNLDTVANISEFLSGQVVQASEDLVNLGQSVLHVGELAQESAKGWGMIYDDTNKYLEDNIPGLKTVDDWIVDWVRHLGDAINKINLLPNMKEKLLPELSQSDPIFTPDAKAALEDLQAELARGWVTTTEYATAAERLGISWADAIAMAEQARSPLEQYHVALEKIAAANELVGLTAEEMSRMQVTAAASAIDPWLDVASTVGGALATMFKDNKAVAIGQAVINTAQAITKSLAEYGFTPLGIAAAAASAAAGAAQIATIASAQPGSSSKPKSKSGTSSATSSGGGGGGGGRGGPSQAVNIILQGQGGFTRDQVIGLADQLNGLVADGATIRAA